VRIEGDSYIFLSHEENNPRYWADDDYPTWATMKLFRYMPSHVIGSGVEPHYHDCDEVWVFPDGRGEAWLDGGPAQPIAPGTFVYTPRGVVHRFQMFTPYSTFSLRTEMQGEKRGTHLIPEFHGKPTVVTGKGWVVSGEEAVGEMPDPARRSPLSDLRVVRGPAAERGTVAATEYWVNIEGRLTVTVDGFAIGLGMGDIAILRAGADRAVSGPPGFYGFARERVVKIVS
jgi:mannose-6-phosphate isomerase-like protein (cupin superfamily)